MRCPSEGTWRAWIDKELEPQVRKKMEDHRHACPACQRQVARLQATMQRTQPRLVALAPAQEVQADAASKRWLERVRDESVSRSTLGRSMMDARSWHRVWRPVLIGTAIVALLVGIFSFAPSRALARQLLSVFRVHKFAVVEINADPARMEQVARTLENKLFLGDPEVVADEPVQAVSSLDEASERVGFQARLPQEGFAPSLATIEVKGRSEAAFPVTRDNVTVLLQLAEMDEGQLPADWAGGTVRITIPAAVSISQGPYHLLEVLDPTVEYPDGIEPGLIGEAGLRVLGLSPAEAKRISANIDWTSTVVLPIPTSLGDFREVTIAGGQGVLLGPRSRGGTSGAEATLLWQKDDVVYVLSGPRSYETLLRMAESMFR